MWARRAPVFTKADRGAGMTGPVKVRLTADCSDFGQFVERIAAFVAENPTRSKEVRELFLGVFDASDEVVSFEYLAASSTGELRVFLKPSDCLLRLETALGARNV